MKPTGWHLVKYDNVDGKYLYNRCHLMAYMLAAENANPQNLITGTRYLNVRECSLLRRKSAIMSKYREPCPVPCHSHI